MTQVGTTFFRYPATFAHAAVAFADRPTDADTLVINGVTITYTRGALANLDADIDAIVALINASTDVGLAGLVTATAAPAGASSTEIILTADVAGTAANAYALDASDLTNGTASAATFQDGTAPADKEEVIARHVFTASDVTVGSIIIQTGFAKIMEQSSVFLDAGIITTHAPVFTTSGGALTITKGTETWAAGDVLIVTVAGYIESK